MTNNALTYWTAKQLQDNKQGVPAKIYYKATKDGITPYKYVTNENGIKKIIIIEDKK